MCTPKNREATVQEPFGPVPSGVRSALVVRRRRQLQKRARASGLVARPVFRVGPLPDKTDVAAAVCARRVAMPLYGPMWWCRGTSVASRGVPTFALGLRPLDAA